MIREPGAGCDRSSIPAGCPARQTNGWRELLILLALLSLTISVATRYCHVSGAQSQTLKSAKANPLDGKRQHLLNNGLHWSAPVEKFVLLLPAFVPAIVRPAASPIVQLYSTDCLHNRPP